MKKLLLTLVLLGISQLAFAVCPTNSACLSVDPTPGWDTGDPMRADAQIIYTFYRFDPVKNTGVPLGTRTQLFSDKSRLLVQFDKEPPGKQCYLVDASVDTGNGLARSPVSSTTDTCKTIMVPVPKLVTPPNFKVE